MQYTREKSWAVSNSYHPQGRYIPVFASAIYDKNAELVQAGLTPVNLTSIMLGKASPGGNGLCILGKLTLFLRQAMDALISA